MHARGVLPMMAYMERLRSKGVHFSSLRVIDSYLKDSAFTAVERSKQGMLKGYHLSIEGIPKGYLFREKWYIKG